MAHKPKSISHVEAASLPVVGLTAVQALRDFSNIKPDDKVLIHAGAGGVGSFAIQYARIKGAIVYATASKKNHELMVSLGAHHCIDYHDEDFVEVCRQAGGMDIVLETLGGLNYPKSILATRDGGAVPCIVNAPDADSLTLASQRKIKTDFFLLEGKPSDLKEIAALVDGGQIKPNVTKTITLNDVAMGHNQIASGHTRGKWVIDVRPATHNPSSSDSS
jgi:NADPH:quinone reductase-like Zn-dependent oxidoreductase